MDVALESLVAILGGRIREVMYSEKVTIYMSYEQRREIERAAHAAHLKVSDWCRRELAAAVSRSTQSARERDDKDKRPR